MPWIRTCLSVLNKVLSGKYFWMDGVCLLSNGSSVDARMPHSAVGGMQSSNCVAWINKGLDRACGRGVNKKDE